MTQPIAGMLKAGRDYSLWPALKLARARELHATLGNLMYTYRVSLGPQTRAEISDDGLSVTFHSRVTHSPPIYDWSLIFADVVHNYRTALDALAWEIVHLGGTAPPEAYVKQIYFPFAETKSAWDKLTRTGFANVPDYMIGRLLALQPFLVEPAAEGIGVYLHKMDIADKHKALLHLELVPQDRRTFHWMFRPEDPEADSATSWSNYEWLAGDQPLRDGMPICRFTMSAKVSYAELPELPLVPMVEVNGGRQDAMHLLEMIDKQISATFTVINQGPSAGTAGSETEKAAAAAARSEGS